MSTDHTVTARYDTVFHHAYAVEQPDLRRLYEQAKRDQWNVSRDIDWSRPVDLDSAVVADELIDIYGTPYWERLGPRERAELNRRFTAWRLSVLLYGEHGAMLACSQLVETVSGLRDRGIAVLWIEHIVHVLMQVVSRLVCMDAGRIIADGTPEVVVAQAAVIDAYLGSGS